MLHLCRCVLGQHVSKSAPKWLQRPRSEVLFDLSRLQHFRDFSVNNNDSNDSSDTFEKLTYVTYASKDRKDIFKPEITNFAAKYGQKIAIDCDYPVAFTPSDYDALLADLKAFFQTNYGLKNGAPFDIVLTDIEPNGRFLNAINRNIVRLGSDFLMNLRTEKYSEVLADCENLVYLDPDAEAIVDFDASLTYVMPIVFDYANLDRIAQKAKKDGVRTSWLPIENYYQLQVPDLLLILAAVRDGVTWERAVLQFKKRMQRQEVANWKKTKMWSQPAVQLQVESIASRSGHKKDEISKLRHKLLKDRNLESYFKKSLTLDVNSIFGKQ